MSGIYFFLSQGSVDGAPKEVLFQRGSSIASVSKLLHKEGVVQHPKMMKWLMRLTGGSTKVRAGEFAFKENMSALDALNVIYHGEPITHPVTIPEGYSVKQIADLLAARKLGNKERFLEIALSAEGAAKFKLKSPTLEGFLYPDTYAFSRIDTEQRMIEAMVQHFFAIANPLMKEFEGRNNMTLEQVTTLASIIEKETGAPNERPLISSVFHNRLKKGMRLQSDPTCIYGIPNYNGNITKKDLQTYSPYNTYKINGLPPGPIASPGALSLRAALEPASSDYLYFVAGTSGQSIFTKNLKSHNKHVHNEQVLPLKKKD